MKKTIWGNTVVKNEGRYIWFALNSIINFLDKILIYDTGSSDDTVAIIELLRKKFPQKILFNEVGEVDSFGLTSLRQKMLEETKSDWLLIVDGDEVWWRNSIKKVIQVINSSQGDRLYALVTPGINLVGDIYHYQNEQSGEYELLGKKGHFNIRAINRKIPGLYIKNEYPLEGFYDKSNQLIQQAENKLKFVDAPLLHFSHLKRSSYATGDQKAVKRGSKLKYEMGVRFLPTFQYPEVFYNQRPDIVQSPWQRMSTTFRIRALIETPLKKIKRSLFII